MRQYIKHLQSKEEHVRKQILIVSVAISMVLVSFVWIYSLGARFSPTVADQTNQDVKPFKMFGDSIASTLKNIGASVGSINFSKKDSTPEQKQIRLIPVDSAKQ